MNWYLALEKNETMHCNMVSTLGCLVHFSVDDRPCLASPACSARARGTVLLVPSKTEIDGGSYTRFGLDFLTVQDSSIGDIVTDLVSQTDF